MSIVGGGTIIDDDDDGRYQRRAGCRAPGVGAASSSPSSSSMAGLTYNLCNDSFQTMRDAVFGECHALPTTPPLASMDACGGCAAAQFDEEIHDEEASIEAPDPEELRLRAAAADGENYPKKKSPEDETVLIEYQEGDVYLIENPWRRFWCICCVLLVCLPAAYILGFYLFGGFPLIFGDDDDGSSSGDITALVAAVDTAIDDGGLDLNATSTNDTLYPTSIHTTPPTASFPSNTIANTGDDSLGNDVPFPNPTLSPVVVAASLTAAPVTTAAPIAVPTVLPSTPSPVQTISWDGVVDSTTHTLTSGPMVGHTTHQSTTVWAYYEGEEEMELVYGPLDESSTYVPIRSVPMSFTNADVHGVSMVQVGGLLSNTVYRYEIRIIDDENERVAAGQFKTAPPPAVSTDFNYVLTSCMNVKRNRGYPEQPVWDVIREEIRLLSPQTNTLDFAIMAGDTVYLNDEDWTSDGEMMFDRIWIRNMEQRAESHFADFVANVPTYSTWDDHDYGLNNADRRQLGKEHSLRAFSNLWPNAGYGTEEVPGVFYTFTWGDVQFLVMDNRWYRDRQTETQFGSLQLEWLYDQLKTSTAVFKVIVTGADIMERGMAEDVEAIGAVVTAHRISGVLFNAGDIHRNEFKTRYLASWPYNVTQITSSGIAREWRRPFALINVNTNNNNVQNPAVTVSFYGANNTSLDTFWTNTPDVRCRDVVPGDRFNEHRCTEIIPLSDLTAA